MIIKCTTKRSDTIMTDKQPQYFGKDLEAMSFAQNYHKWILEEIAPFVGKHLAEIGAGVGNFSDFLLGLNIESLNAYEPSANMYPYLEKKFTSNESVATHNCFFESVVDQFHNHFDSVIYINVLEHIENDVESLLEAQKTLKQDGHIIVFVPALPFLYSDLDKSVGHFRRYTESTLTDTANKAGLEIESIKYFDIAGIIPWYIAFVLLKHTATTGNVSLYDKLVIPIMKKVEQMITPPVGKNLLMIARKK